MTDGRCERCWYLRCSGPNVKTVCGGLPRGRGGHGRVSSDPGRWGLLYVHLVVRRLDPPRAPSWEASTRRWISDGIHDQGRKVSSGDWGKYLSRKQTNRIVVNIKKKSFLSELSEM